MRLASIAALILFISNPLLLAADSSDEQSGGSIDVMGKVADHDYFETAFGKIYLPRI
jgi:hypothetical protein